MTKALDRFERDTKGKPKGNYHFAILEVPSTKGRPGREPWILAPMAFGSPQTDMELIKGGVVPKGSSFFYMASCSMCNPGNPGSPSAKLE